MDRNRQSINEMEQIQKGLEAFLEQELREIQKKEDKKEYKREDKLEVTEPEEEELEEITLDELDFQEDWEEDLIEMQENDRIEREINVIDSSRQQKTDKRHAREDYFEDWDSAEHRQRVAAKKQQRKSEKKASSGKSDKVKYQEEIQDNRKTKKKKRKKKSRLFKFVIAVAVVVVLLGVGLYSLVGSIYSKMNYENIDSVATAPMQEDGVVNVLLIGNDSRENGSDGRSDAMILLSISKETKKIYMTSLLRDMYVDIPGYKGNRLNAAYSYGGAELLMETIEENFDISVNRYVLVNFEAFANLVDAVGGVNLELTGEEIEYVNAYLVEYNILTGRPEGTDYMDNLSGGLVHLNGPQALAYSRNRFLGNDFGRTERQRKILEGIIKELPTALVTNPKELLGGILPNLTTNLTQGEIYRLSLMASKLLTYDMVQGSIPVEGTYTNATIRDMSVLEVDFEANKQYIRENIYGEGQAEE